MFLVSGHYIYVEASNRSPNQRTSIISPALSLPYPDNCLKFWYSMYGSTMGELHIYRLNRGTRQLLWRKSGNQGLQWLMGEVSIPGDTTSPISLEFEGVVGSSYTSDIGIDDLSLRAGHCDSTGTNLT